MIRPARPSLAEVPLADLSLFFKGMLSFAALKEALGVEPFLAGGDPRQAWRSPEAVAHVQLVLDSFARFVGRELVPRNAPPLEQARMVFEAPFVVVSHGNEADSVLNDGNRTALGLWEMTWEGLTRTPSRLTAEPLHRDEMARLLERTRAAGFVDDYSGIGVSSSGRRFRIEQAIVWNLVDESGMLRGRPPHSTAGRRSPGPDRVPPGMFGRADSPSC